MNYSSGVRIGRSYRSSPPWKAPRVPPKQEQSAHPRRMFSHAVLDAAQKVLMEHGEAGYRAKWVFHPFPVGLLQDLRRLHLRNDACVLSH